MFAGVFVVCLSWFCFLMIRRPPRSTQSSSSAASVVYMGQVFVWDFDSGAPLSIVFLSACAV